jgi:hypothetical protein
MSDCQKVKISVSALDRNCFSSLPFVSPRYDFFTAPKAMMMNIIISATREKIKQNDAKRAFC